MTTAWEPVEGNVGETIRPLDPPEDITPAQDGAVGQLLMAKLFVADHGERVRYVHRVGWHVWDGKRFQERADEPQSRAVVWTAEQAVARGLAQVDKELVKVGRKMQSSASGMKAVVELARALPPISTTHEQLDADPYLFNTPSGTLDLSTGATKPHSPADLITKISGAGRDPDGDGLAGWAEFLERILPDQEVRSFLQRVIGYSMSGKVTAHLMPILTGSGANGKGTFRDAVLSAFGDYADEADPALLMESKSERHGAFRMKLRGKRLVFVSETEEGKPFAPATMKRLTGGDPIEANYMRQNPITFDPTHTLIMLTNHLPTVSGSDDAVWRRVYVVPFDVVIPLAEQDGELPSRLKLASAEIIDWAFEGWKQFQRRGIDAPDAVLMKTREYRESSDSIAKFLEDRVDTDQPTMTTGCREMFMAWQKWCGEVNEQPGTETMFGREMVRRGFVKEHVSSGARYRGLLVRNPHYSGDESGHGGFASKS